MIDNPSYFCQFIDLLYNEWNVEYAKNGLFNKRSVKSFYKKYMRGIYVLMEDERIVGCYNLTGNRINDVCVNSGMRKMGFGRRLIKDALQKLWFYPVATLSCKPDLVNYYRSVGFLPYSALNENIKMIRVNWYMIIMICVCFLYVMINTFFLL